jgi:hypothetical protein
MVGLRHGRTLLKTGSRKVMPSRQQNPRISSHDPLGWWIGDFLHTLGGGALTGAVNAFSAVA